MDFNEKKLSIISDIVESYDLGLLLGVKEILERSDAASTNYTVQESREVYNTLADDKLLERMDALKVEVLKAFNRSKDIPQVEKVYGYLNNEDIHLSEDDKRDLDEAWAEYEANPDDVVSWEEAKKLLGYKE